MDPRRAFGDAGERLAAAELMRGGASVVDRNARTRYGEIDLVCRDRDGFVFVEVKTRRASSFVTAHESVSTAKARRLATLAQAWLAHRNERAAPYRLLVAAVTVHVAGSSVSLIPIDRC